MATVMQRWNDTKIAFDCERARILECAIEARDLIKSQCDQDLFAERFRWYATEAKGIKIDLQWNYGAVEPHKICVEIWAVDGTFVHRGDLWGHWPIPLREAERLIDALRRVNTGTFVSAWEAEQQ